ncbi:MAG: zinc-dependent peptidase [Opitutales bacterium]
MNIWERLKSIFQTDEPVEAVFKPEWIAYLEKNLPLYARLPESLKTALHQKIGYFVRSTFFEGCGDLELSEEMIITVAGQACILIMNHPGEPYPNLKSVILYPSAFKSKTRSVDAMGIVTEKEVVRLGESWSNGTVVLAWDWVLRGAKNIFDGKNVAFHEFAHQLDQENGPSDGVPILSDSEEYHTWSQVLFDEYQELCKKAAKRKRSVMDHYGALNSAEFFAVATESFLEKPKQMRKKHRELFEELRDYYGFDPTEW